MSFTTTELRALRYMWNALPNVAQFDEDHEPIGPMLRGQLLAKAAILVEGRDMCLTIVGRKAIGESTPDDELFS